MTVILDPGNATESYSDAQRRQWQASSGLWKVDAKDVSAGAHPPGFTSGQLWSETAAEWKADRDAVYTSRYNDGYSAGSSAGSSSGYSQGYSDGQTAGHTAGYNEGYTAGNTAGYNSGYAAGAASKTTTGASSTAWTNIGAGALSGTPTGDLISLVVPRAGLAHVSCVAGCGQGGGSANAQLHVYVNGALALSGPTLGAAAAGNPQYAVVQHQFNAAAGQTVSIRATGTSTAHLNQGGTLLLTVGTV